MKKIFTKEQIKEILKNSTDEIIEDSEKFVDEFCNVHNINDVVTKAEECVKTKYHKINDYNKETQKAVEEVENGIGLSKVYDNIDEMFEDLDS